MSEPTVRRAESRDIDELVQMRSDFTFEDPEADPEAALPGYESDCRSFLERALAEERWQIWVAEIDGQLVAHLYVALVDRVPRPVREHARIAYLTNVYTRPGHRGRGIGGRLLERAQAAARDAGAELLLVWPGEESVRFYEHHGFGDAGAPLVWHADGHP